jgi:hypothetical protein
LGIKGERSHGGHSAAVICFILPCSPPSSSTCAPEARSANLRTWDSPTTEQTIPPIAKPAHAHQPKPDLGANSVIWSRGWPRAVGPCARFDPESRRRLLVPVGLLFLIVAQSAFTVSDLFITHYAMLLPLIPISAGVAAAALFGRVPGAFSGTEPGKSISPAPVLMALSLLGAITLWWTADLWTAARYHEVLSILRLRRALGRRLRPLSISRSIRAGCAAGTGLGPRQPGALPDNGSRQPVGSVRI